MTEALLFPRLCTRCKCSRGGQQGGSGATVVRCECRELTPGGLVLNAAKSHLLLDVVACWSKRGVAIHPTADTDLRANLPVMRVRIEARRALV
eukprot:COSAG06_NODE_1393_length_9596_cov_47.877014_9_plen_93_part_00